MHIANTCARNACCHDKRLTSIDALGDTQIWFGWGCAAGASKPKPILKGHLGQKRKKKKSTHL